ncbi:MAG TPA: MoaD/ThiS family protein [Planctomycetota bacterium]|nr:MoaD/ThiS family protein [Planctomycetota bacterium]
MIRVRVTYCAQARAAAGVASDEVQLDGACTPGDLLIKVAELRGESLRRIILDSSGRPHPSVLLFVGGEQVPVNAALALKDGDEIEIVPPMSGG